MERLTYDFCVAGNHCWQIKGADNLECREVYQQMEEKGGCKACPIANAFNRLAAIEDILGDDYDLDRMRDLVHTDRDGRLVVLPCKPGCILRHDGRDYEADHWNILLTAFSDDASTKSGKKVRLFSMDEASEAAQKGEQDG